MLWRNIPIRTKQMIGTDHLTRMLSHVTAAISSVHLNFLITVGMKLTADDVMTTTMMVMM